MSALEGSRAIGEVQGRRRAPLMLHWRGELWVDISRHHQSHCIMDGWRPHPAPGHLHIITQGVHSLPELHLLDNRRE